MISGHILRGPTDELGRQRDELWCFGCRKRLAGDLILLDYPEGSPHYGWYEPVMVYRCDGCGEDRRLFPGWEWKEVEE